MTDSPVETDIVRQKQPRSAAGSGVVVVAGGLWIATLWWLLVAKFNFGLNDWVLKPDAAWPIGAWLLPLFVLILLGGLAGVCAYDRFRRAKTPREQRASTRLSIGALSLLALVWPWVLQGPGTPQRPGVFNLVSTTWSDVSNQYFSLAYQIRDAREFSRTYADLRQERISPHQAHVATHPPGATLIFYGARLIYEHVPPLQALFTGLSHALIAPESDEATILSRLADERDSATRSASSQGRNAPAPFALPASALGGALWCSFLLSLAVALTVPAIYALARDSGRTRDDAERAQSDGRGLFAAALWALCPSALFYAFTLDAVIACIGAWALVCFARRLRGGSLGWGVGAGALWAFATWLSFGAAALGAIFFFATGLRRRARPFYELALLLAGFVAMWGVLLLLFPTPLGRVYSQAMEAHHWATLQVRSRWGWAVLNLLFFAVFAGCPLVTLVAAEIRRRMGRKKQNATITVTSQRIETGTPETIENDRRLVMQESVPESASDTAAPKSSLEAGIPGGTPFLNAWSAGQAIGAAAVVTMLLLTFSGSVRGEVERLWMFLLPALCAWAGWGVIRRPSVVWIALLGMQAVQAFLMAAVLMPIVHPI